MHRSRSFRSAVLLFLLMFLTSYVAVPVATADDLYADGEPTDPQRILDLLEQIGADLDALGVTVTSSLEALWNALQRALGLIPPEESGS